MSRTIGILTSGGDCPGLNAAIRAVGKAVQDRYAMRLIGFQNGFRGLVQNQHRQLDGATLSGILTDGGTILGTSRDKPHRMMMGGKPRNMIDACVETYERCHLDGLVCIGGGGTQKNAARLLDAGLNIITLPKTIDNDVAGTDISFGFDTAREIATEAIDRLHSTAMSHGRIIVVEVMGHRAGWLALGSGIAGGADVILIPEIPYEPARVAEAIINRAHAGKQFSIVVVAEGAMSVTQEKTVTALVQAKQKAKSKAEKSSTTKRLDLFHQRHVNHTMELTRTLERLTGLESRLTILGHLQRGGSPSATDRVLASCLGTTCAERLHAQHYGAMVAMRNGKAEPVPLSDIAGKKKLVPPEHPLVHTARHLGTSFGD